MIRKFTLPAILCLATAVSACVLQPYPGAFTAEERYAFYLATRDDPEHAALAAAGSELADRNVAGELLRELANRYRVAGREKTLATFNAAAERDRAATTVVSAQLRAPAPPSAAAHFGALVQRCLETVSASAGKPTYNPKLFDWLCRAAILPEVTDPVGNGRPPDEERTAGLAVSVGRLIGFAERCKGVTGPYCGDADKLISQLINQQPVTPIPQHMNKISVDRTAVPTPSAEAATTTANSTQTN